MTNSFVICLLVVLAISTSAGQTPPAPVDQDHRLRRGVGWVFTFRYFLDFEMDFEFRVRKPGRRGAVLVRAHLSGGSGRAGYAISLSDKSDGKEALGRIGPRRSTFVKPDSQERQFDTQELASVMRPAGEWQRVRVVSDREGIRVFVNGALITVAETLPWAGHIGFEGDGRDIDVRGWRVQRHDTYSQPLPPSTPDLPYVTNVDYTEKRAVPPKIIREVKPVYSPEAMRARAVGLVSLEALVLTDGTVGPIRVVKPLDLDLDQTAVAAMRQWRFTPAQKDGQPVAARIEVEMTFTLK